MKIINTNNGMINIFDPFMYSYIVDNSDIAKVIAFNLCNKLRSCDERIKKIHLFADRSICIIDIESMLKIIIAFIKSIGYNRKVDIILHYKFRFKEHKITFQSGFKFDPLYDLIIDETKVSYFNICKDSYYKISLGDISGITVDKINTKQMIDERNK